MTTITYELSFAQENAPRPGPLTEPASGGTLGGCGHPGAEDTAARRRYNRSNPRQMGCCGVPRSSENGCGADQRVIGAKFAVDATHWVRRWEKCVYRSFPGETVKGLTPMTAFPQGNRITSEGRDRLITRGAPRGLVS
jgi:hypothetical protein